VYDQPAPVHQVVAVFEQSDESLDELDAADEGEQSVPVGGVTVGV
jgi:hypothetical protein